MRVLDQLYTLITVLNLGLAVAVIFLERKNVAVTWAWLMVLLFIPVAGFVLYLVFGQNLSKVKLYKVNKRYGTMLADLVETQRSEFRKMRVHLNDPAMESYYDMIYMNLTSSSAFYTQNNSVEIFTDGRSKFDSLFQAIEQAEDTIHLMYYIVQNDELGRELVNRLAAKAAEGVKVRFLYDDIGSSGLPHGFFKPLKDAGGEVAAFFPSKVPYLNFRVNYRNHRKLFIVDGKIGYLGGFNVGNEYLGIVKRYGFWRDTHLKLTGHSVLQMQGQFLLDWNLASSNKLEAKPKLFPVHGGGGTVGVQIVSSGPSHPIEHIRNAYIKMIHAAKMSIYIQTPYFIPDESILTALRMAVLSGVDVRLMIPGKPDHRLVYWATRSYLGELIPLGMRCFFYNKGFLHAKMIVIDGKVASVGTANLDIRSFKLNFEVNAVLYDTETAGRLARIFEEDMGDCTEWTLEEYEHRSRIHKIRESCMRLLSPIL